MNQDSFRSRLRRGDTLIGTWSVVPSPEVVEILALAGFDFVIIDLEHGPCDYARAQELVRAAEVRGCAAMLRVSSNRESEILRGLEIGSAGILVPHVSNASAAQRVVESARYSPEGSRGFSPYTRAANFGAGDPSRIAGTANESITTGVLVEGVEGVENIDQISGTPGVDLVYVGVYDLAQSLGYPGEPGHPEVQKQVRELSVSVRNSGPALGILVESHEDVGRWVESGVGFLAYRADCSILLDAARDIVAAGRQLGRKDARSSSDLNRESSLEDPLK